MTVRTHCNQQEKCEEEAYSTHYTNYTLTYSYKASVNKHALIHIHRYTDLLVHIRDTGFQLHDSPSGHQWQRQGLGGQLSDHWLRQTARLGLAHVAVHKSLHIWYTWWALNIIYGIYGMVKINITIMALTLTLKLTSIFNCRINCEANTSKSALVATFNA